LTENIKGTVVILCDSIVLDGAGHTLQGNGNGVGVFLQARKDVTVKNLRISNFNFGIKCPWLYMGSYDGGNTFSDNTLTDNTYGIYINDYSIGNTLSGNTLSHNTYGICLESCSNNTLRNNQMNNNDFNFFVSGGTLSTSINDADQSNTINGAPIIYWVNERSKIVSENAGYIALVKCTNITIEKLDLAHNGQAILLAGTTNCTLADNTIKENHNGIWLIESQNNQINHNKITSNAYAALCLSSSEATK
jgi:parallel beta-helix repeat protein